MKSRSFVALAVAAGAIFATPAVAQTGEALILSLFSTIEREFHEKGQRMTLIQEFENAIEDGSERGNIIQLDRGTYWIVGVCDEDCSDFDLAVKNMDAEVVGSDLLADDAPIVILENARRSAYQIQSIMADCSMDPCLTGVRVYRRD